MCPYLPESRRGEETVALEEENRRKREKVVADKAGIERAQVNPNPESFTLNILNPNP